VKGSYVLIMQLPRQQTITIGSLSDVYFPRGYYAYVGSAMGRFKPRLNYHLKGNKKPHWHIDYLLAKAFITDIILCETKQRSECTIAQALKGQFDAIPGFGASDCKCNSHLFFAPKEMKTTIMATLNHLSIKSRLAQEYLDRGVTRR